MKLKSVVLLAVAVACGLVAMLGVQQALSNKGKEEKIPTAKVLVATTDIAPGVRLDESNTGFKEVALELVPPGAVTKAEEYTDRALRGGAVAGEMIMVAKLGEKGVFGASGEIPKGMRVITVPVTATTTHSGLIRPGDRVDVMVTFKVRIAGEGMAAKTRTVLEYIKVFATDSLIAGDTPTGDGTEIKAKNISLLVWPEQAQDLMTAKSEGELHLALRHKNDGPAAEEQDRPRISQQDREQFQEMVSSALDLVQKMTDGGRTSVLVASADVLPGTRLDESNTAFKQMPNDLVPPGAITTPDAFEDRALLGGAVAGELILATQLGEKGVFGASAEIPMGLRVVTVPVDLTKTHSGRIRPGDRVDVLLTYKFEVPDEPIRYESTTSVTAPQDGSQNATGAAIAGAGAANAAAGQGVEKSEKVEVPQKKELQKTKTVLECIKIFATDGHLAGQSGNEDATVKSQNISLLVDPDQANILTQAASMGTLHLALRHGLDCEPARAVAVDERMLDAAPVNIARTCDLEPQQTEPVVETGAPSCNWRVKIHSGTDVRVQNFKLSPEECPEPAI
jgi:pilus assembly protein CpaB